MSEKIIKFVIRVSTGMSQAVVISPDRAYVRPESRSFQIDSVNLRKDAKKVGNDLKKTLDQYSYGESAYQR